MIAKNSTNYDKCSAELTALLHYIQNVRKKSGSSVYTYWKNQALVVSLDHDSARHNSITIKRAIGELCSPKNLYQLLSYSSEPIPQDIVLIRVFAITMLSHSKIVRTIGLPNIQEERIMNRLLRGDAEGTISVETIIAKVRNKLSIIAVNGLVPL